MTQPNTAIEVLLEGRGKCIIRPSDYVSTGGEATVYRLKDTVVKLYSDSNKALRENMGDKLRLLSKIKHPYIVSPQGLVTSTRGVPIGFYMPYADGEPFPRVFTNDFRVRTGFNDSDAALLAHRMHDVVQMAHGHHALMVDANELNWLAVLRGGNGPEPRIIDVDSWAIGAWPPTVVMPSIRDWHAKTFDAQSDWFAWGIVSFELFLGIHPYKGTLSGFKSGDLEGRMKANASVFRDGVRLNRAVRDFHVIPGPLLDWYKAVFELGERSVPPSPLQRGVSKTPQTIRMRLTASAHGTLIYEKLFCVLGDSVVRVFPCGVALLASGRLVNLRDKRDIGRVRSLSAEVVRVEHGWLVADWESGNLLLAHVNERALLKTELPLSVHTRTIVRYENRLFAVTENGLSEIVLTFLGKPIVSLGQTWGAMENATRWFDGVGVQDAMGAQYLIAPFDEHACAHVRARELDGMRPLYARAGHRFVVVIASDRSGAYRMFEFAFNADYTRYAVESRSVDTPSVNAALLPKGVSATIMNDGEIEIFVPSSGVRNVVRDKNIATDMTLSHWDNRVVYIHHGEVWQVRMQ